MPEGFSNLNWTDFWVQIGIGLAALASVLAGVAGYFRPKQTSGNISAVMMDREDVIRLTTSFEAMARILARQEEIIESNTEQLQANTRVLKAIGDFSEQAAKDMRSLTIELENTRRSK